jgi:hypothetical protein
MQEDNHKSSHQKKLPKLNSSLGIFFVCLLLSVLLWLLTVFGKPYNTTISFATRFFNLPTNKTLVNRLPRQVNVRVKGTGFSLMAAFYNAKYDTLLIDGQNIRKLYDQQSNEGYFLVLNNQLINIASQLGDKIEVYRIDPDTVKFMFDQKTGKIVPVKVNISYHFAKQYQQSGPIKIYPSKILIKGPGLLLEDIDIIETKNIVLTGIDKTTKTLVPLKIPAQNGNIEYPTKWAVIEIPAEKFTEAEISLPVKVVNGPPGFKVKTFPSEITVKYNVALSNYGQVNQSMFEVVVDFKAIENANASKLTVKLVKLPGMVSNARLVNKKVEFILHRD